MYHGNKLDASDQASLLRPQAQAGNRVGTAAFACPSSEAFDSLAGLNRQSSSSPGAFVLFTTLLDKNGNLALFIISLRSKETKGTPLAFDDKIYELRREKLKQIEALGQATYRSKYEFTHTFEQILAKYTEKTGEELERDRVHVRVAGRIMAIRAQGKAGFATLQQASVWADSKADDWQNLEPGLPRLQIYVRLDAVGEQAFALYKLLDLGDHIGVKGFLMRTRTGELTVHVTSLTFLAKAMLALPETGVRR